MEHGRDFPDYPRVKRKLANRVLLDRGDGLVAVGECVRQALVANEGLPLERIELVYNGIELHRYDPTRTRREALRRQMSFTTDNIVIIQVARLNRLKDHPTAIRAMAQLRLSCPEARLVLVGDGEERSEIELLIDDLAISDHVQLLGVRNDVPDLLQMADLFMLSSITEGVALTLIEAMATGLPCVATDVGGNCEVIVDGMTGLLARANEPFDLANKLETLCQDPNLREQFGQAGLQRALEHFDSHKMHQSMAEIYTRLVESNQKNA